jgi:hypothetical protein
MHVTAELGAADEARETLPRGELAIDRRWTGQPTQRDEQVERDADQSQQGRLTQQGRPLEQARPRVEEHEQDDDRDDRHRQEVVGNRQPRKETAEQQITVSSLSTPDEGAVDDGGHEEEVEAVHLGERGFQPERAAHRQAQSGGRRNHRPRTEAGRDQHGRRGRPSGGHGREEIGAIRP